MEISDPSPELEQQVRLSFSQLEPERIFRHCKVVGNENGILLRVYSHKARFPTLNPTPYWVYRFDPATGVLARLSDKEAEPFLIKNYK
jgi:hypothetical protein